MSDLLQKASNQELLGMAGEIIVNNMLETCGFNSHMSSNKYDSSGDIYLDDTSMKHTYEVKTQSPYIKRNAFTIRENQLKKCMSVDRLFFIFVPHFRFPHPLEGHIFCHFNPKKLLYTIEPIQNRIMAVIPFKQDGMEIWGKLTKTDIEFMAQYSTSEFK